MSHSCLAFCLFFLSICWCSPSSVCLSHTHLQCPRGKAMAQTLHPHILLLPTQRKWTLRLEQLSWKSQSVELLANQNKTLSPGGGVSTSIQEGFVHRDFSSAVYKQELKEGNIVLTLCHKVLGSHIVFLHKQFWGLSNQSHKHTSECTITRSYTMYYNHKHVFV